MEIEKLKQKILDLAIRGKLVPQDQNDEPASVLVDRIRAQKEELIKQGKIKRSKEDSYIYKGSDNCYYEKVGENETKINFKEPVATRDCIWMKGYQIFKPMRSIGKIYSETIDYIDIDAIDNKANKIKCAKNILSKNAPSRAKRRVENGSTLFSMVRPYLRNIAYVEEQYEHCVASTGFYVCTPQFFIEPKYLYYLMISPYVVNGINFYMKGDNSPSVRSEQIESFLFPIPSLKRQQKIAKLLDTVFNKIDLLKNDISKLNSFIAQLKSKILDDIFGENSRYKSYYEKRTKTTLEKLVKSENIGDGDWVLSENMNPKGDIKLVQLKHIGKNVFLNKPFCHVDEDFFTQNNFKEIKEGYLLINRLVANEMTCCILPQMDEKCITAVDVCWIAPDSHYNLKYLMYYLISSAFQKQVLMKCSGSTRKRISKTNLIKIELNIHSFDIQEKIVKDIENYFNILDKMSNSI